MLGIFGRVQIFVKLTHHLCRLAIRHRRRNNRNPSCFLNVMNLLGNRDIFSSRRINYVL
jgi:hypothetical protein